MRGNEAFLVAESWAKRLKTRNPFRIAAELDVEVWRRDLGRIKGLYTCIDGQRFIVVSEGLDWPMSDIVCAHELGHDLLHRELATNRWLREFEMYNMKNSTEYEANCFAAELLIEDEELLELAERGCNVEQCAVALSSDVNLVALKVKSLRNRGYNLRLQNYKSNFLK